MVTALKVFAHESKARTTCFKIALLFALLFFTQMAFAQGIFTVDAGDTTRKDILAKLFGELVGGGNDPFAALIKSFNQGVLMVGGLLGGYTIIRAIIGTAHEGEAFGRQFSSVYVPIRMAMGVLFIIPFGGGYCLIQHLVMWVILQSVGFANKMWDDFSANFLDNSGFSGMNSVQMSATPSESRKNALSVLSNHICMETYNEAGIGGGIKEYVLSQDEPVPGLKKIEYAFGGGNNADFDLKSVCGKVTVSVKLQGSQSNAQINKLFDEQKKAYEKLSKDMNGVAKKIVDDDESVSKISGDLAKAIKEYIDASKKLNQEALVEGSQTAFEGITKDLNKDGWILAGAYFIDFTKEMGKLRNQTGDGISVRELERSLLDNSRFEHLKRNYEKANNVLDDSGNSGLLSVYEQGGGVEIKGAATAMNSWLFGVDLGDLANDNRHPIEILSSIGGTLLTIGLSVTAMNALLCAIPLLVSFCGAITPFTSGIGITALTTGLMYLYYIPLIPFIVWIGAVVGWLILVFESMFAAPLWAMMHIHPNGDDFTGRAGNGYSLILSLALRPALMIAGLAAALGLLIPIVTLLNRVFADVLASSVEGISFFGVLFSLIIYGGIVASLMKQMCSLIYLIPDRILRWVGGSDNLINQAAKQMEGQTSQTAKKGIGQVAKSGADTAKGVSMGVNKNLSNKAKATETKGELGLSLMNAGSKQASENAKKLDSANQKQMLGRLMQQSEKKEDVQKGLDLEAEGKREASEANAGVEKGLQKVEDGQQMVKEAQEERGTMGGIQYSPSSRSNRQERSKVQADQAKNAEASSAGVKSSIANSNAAYSESNMKAVTEAHKALGDLKKGSENMSKNEIESKLNGIRSDLASPSLRSNTEAQNLITEAESMSNDLNSGAINHKKD